MATKRTFIISNCEVTVEITGGWSKQTRFSPREAPEIVILDKGKCHLEDSTIKEEIHRIIERENRWE